MVETQFCVYYVDSAIVLWVSNQDVSCLLVVGQSRTARLSRYRYERFGVRLQYCTSAANGNFQDCRTVALQNEKDGSVFVGTQGQRTEIV